MKWVGIVVWLLVSIPDTVWSQSQEVGTVTFVFQDCQARWTHQQLTLGNAFIQRQWRIENGLLVNASLRDNVTGKEQLLGASPQPSPIPEFEVRERCLKTTITADTLKAVVVETTALLVTVRSEYESYALTTFCKIFPRTSAVSTWLRIEQKTALATGTVSAERVTGIETGKWGQTVKTDLTEVLLLDHVHRQFLAVTLMDHTDDKDNLVQVNEFLLTNPSTNSWAGNLFFLEDQFTKDGLIFLKEAPLPYARPVKSAADLRQSATQFAFTGLGAGADSVRESYPFTTMTYQNGKAGRTAVLQHYQRRFRTYKADRDELIWHSIWGDRNRDGRMTEAFLSEEMELNRQIGIDHLYFIDGWQKGPSSNSVNREQGGLWDNQWSVADYWEPNQARFPNGFDDLVKKAKANGFKIGMWYNPDKTKDYANWKRDTDVLLNFHRRFGANYFKYDGVEFFTKKGEANLLRAMHRIVQETNGQAGIEIDITAGLRTGYFAAMPYGTLFLENRYTDFRRYYPHTTLRNLWQLAQFVDPRRMRMEFLNPERNQHLYPDDPLAPARYPKDYGLAVTLFAKPMAWFETSGLSDSTRIAFAKLLTVYKPHQSAIHQGTIYPIGDEPTGFSWTGFQSQTGKSEGYVIVYREANSESTKPMVLYNLPAGTYRFEHLSGSGKSFRTSTTGNGTVLFSLPAPLNYSFFRYQLLAKKNQP
ncbi:MAG: alpha-galactosidase [Bacteroidetes bacterium]|nr:alpha-galactosidase [Fibrella sp.]